MNLTIAKGDFKIEVDYIDKKDFKEVLISAFNYIEKGSFIDKYESFQATNKVEEPKEKKVKNFTPEVNGIKDYGNGKLGYKCAYRCGCGHKGVRHIVGDEEHVHCHECNEKLLVSPATLNDAHDEEFNYFVAY